MNNIYHFIAREIDPTRGGLEQSAARVAAHIACIPESKVFIYVLNETETQNISFEQRNITVVYLKDQKDLMMEPSAAARSSRFKESEKWQIEFLVFKSAISKIQQTEPTCNHTIISFFVSLTGFIGQQLADSLRMRHIASIRGSDFNRDTKSPSGFAAFSYVATRANWIVTINHEQADFVSRVFEKHHQISTIPNPIACPQDAPIWQPKARDKIHLFSDAGWSFKKGTHILYHATVELLKEGYPIELTVVGNTDKRAPDYWDKLKSDHLAMFPDAFKYKGWCTREELETLLNESDIYCSATIGEGYSTARLRALALGIPVVTTKSGEMAAATFRAEHVRLSEPGDIAGFTANLRKSVICALNGEVSIDPQIIRSWRALFGIENERESWISTVLKATQD